MTIPNMEENDTVEEDKDDKLFVVLLVVVSLLVAVGSGTGIFLLFFLRRWKVFGRVVDTDGEAVEGICVTLDGRETFTNEKGAYAFKGMKRGNHDLCIFDLSDNPVLSLNIYTGSVDDEEVFTILENSSVSVDAHKEGKNYLVDAVITK